MSRHPPRAVRRQRRAVRRQHPHEDRALPRGHRRGGRGGAAARREYERLALEAFDGVDLLLAPTLGFVAPPADIDELAWRERVVRFTYPFNLLGWPALAVPSGPAEDGLPASVPLVGRPGADALVLAAGLVFEAALAVASGP